MHLSDTGRLQYTITVLMYIVQRSGLLQRSPSVYQRSHYRVSLQQQPASIFKIRVWL